MLFCSTHRFVPFDNGHQREFFWQESGADAETNSQALVEREVKLEDSMGSLLWSSGNYIGRGEGHQESMVHSIN